MSATTNIQEIRKKSILWIRFIHYSSEHE